jgi:uncharacterized 2Fe-2S/4Fe-4S cluster protein (DUF4445 family)
MKITIIPNKVITTLENETLMEALIRHRLPVQSVCNGEGTCGKCKVRMTGYVSPPSDRDLEHLNGHEIKSGVRLACAVTPKEGMVIELDFVESQDRKEGVLLGMKVTAVDPGIEKVFVKSGKPSLADERGDLDRIIDALSTITGKNYDKVSLYVLCKVPDVLREGEFALTVTVTEDDVLDIEAGDRTKRLYGVAVDIGTTSVAVALVDLKQGNIIKIVSA